MFLSRMRRWCLLGVLAFSSPVLAMSLQEAMAALGTAKEQGLVGEQANGYLGVVKDSGNAKAIVELINQARRAEYQRVASENGIGVKDVETIAGRKALERTQPGHYIWVDGAWVRK